MLLIENIIDDIPVQTVEEIKKYAEVVNIPKLDVIKGSNSLLIGLTNVVKELKGANLTVFVHILKNEYLSLAFDFWSDPNVEIATYMELVDGIVTEFPATAYRFMSK